MASQYALNLKATLDTQQVQQQLQQLRAAQMSASNGQSTAQGTQIGMGNFSKLDATLAKLNSSVSALQRTIEQLNRIATHPSGSIGKQVQPNASTMPFALSQNDTWKNQGEYRVYSRKWSNALQNVLARNPELAAKAQAKYGSLDNLDIGGVIANRLDNEEYSQQVSKAKKQAQQAANNRVARQNRRIAALIGGQLIGGAGNLMTSLGYETTGNIVGNIGEGVTSGAGAGLAASMAGLGLKASSGIGIAVGLATAISKNISSMEELASAVRKTAEAFEDNYKALHTRTAGINDSIMGIKQQDRADQLLESGNIAEAKKQAKYWNDAYTYSKTALLDMANPTEEEARIRDLAEKKKKAVDDALNGTNLEWAQSTLGEAMFSVMGMPGAATRKQEVKNQIDEDAQRQIEEMQQKYKALEADMNRSKSYAGMYEDVVKQIEAGDQKKLQESAAEVAARVALAERNDASISRYRAAGQANATQAFANSVLGDKLTGPLEKFNKLSEELDKLRSLKNNSLMQAYSIAKDISENGSKMTSDDMKRELAKQGRFEQDAAYAEQRIGIIESALANISTSTLAPDLSHVTSLAQYGFNMGEKDDTVERMEKYYSKSINLQQQIKDKLEQGVQTEAVYN